MDALSPLNNQADDYAQNYAEMLCRQVRDARANRSPLQINGGGSKAFYGRRVAGTPLDTTGYRGIVRYDPVELVVTVRAGTPLRELEAELKAHGQMLSCEPPSFGGSATVGGMVACGLSGPRRPWAGAVRDLVLGMRVIGGEGQLLRFGGEVMKNVAGFDVSRLMVGAQGVLGVLLEVSFKVLPRPQACACLRLEMPLDHALEQLTLWGREPLPLSAACHDGSALHIRLEGGEGSVAATVKRLGGERDNEHYWTALNNHDLPFFADPRPLWRLSLPAATPPLALDGEWLIDWAGMQRWLKSDAEPHVIRDAALRVGGHASCFAAGQGEPFTPLAPVLLQHQRRLKAQLDPARIFNPGRLYAEL
ncbi:glycolate oxidase subunit GlcE [Phytohalomonas tamaricis]|uniref:glycolate oxidase subunit GlcE n=1 Tax=Phytohalomonas tamaricis TaxID=2081032 RepID=UPI000D0B6EC7|nr:glycolate oxidase subunit GlcE [Phytohalomonas tamaricis]